MSKDFELDANVFNDITIKPKEAMILVNRIERAVNKRLKTERSIWKNLVNEIEYEKDKR